MDFSDKLEELAARIERQRSHVSTEEAAKTAFVLPFLQAMGYDVFNPLEVTPEFCADVGVKKGEKVDYAIILDEAIQVLIECKPIGASLELKHASQLYRYFSVTSARFSILTDGIKYLFYTDLDAANKMDQRPFFEFDLSDYKETDIRELKKFTKESFDIEAILSTATDLKYKKALLEELSKELRDPSDEIATIFGKRVYNGRFTAQVSEKFQSLLKDAFQGYIRARIDEKLKNAFDGGSDLASLEEPDASEKESGVETTECEIQGHNIITAIASEYVEPSQIAIRDGKSYCAILFDDNNRKPIARLFFNNPKNLSVVIFTPDEELKLSLSGVSDLHKHKKAILASLSKFVELPGVDRPGTAPVNGIEDKYGNS